MRLLFTVCTAVLALSPGLSAAFPKPDGYVTDAAGILSPATEAALESMLATLERDTSAEVAVATVPSLEGMSIEEYANRLFADWGVGRRQKDNGVLLLIAPTDRELRIEVGYGLEGILPDGLAGDVIRHTITPELKAGDFDAGVTGGVTRLAAIVRRDPSSAAMSEDDDGATAPLFVTVPFFGLFVAIGSFALGLGLRTKTVGTLIFAAMFAFMPFGMFSLFAPRPWLAGMLAFGTAMATFGFRRGGSTFWKETLRDPTRSNGDDGRWQMGSSSSDGSSGGGSSSSSGGSSFGGGSSGGGGASGRW